MRGSTFRGFMASDERLRTLIYSYALALMQQIGRTSGCNRLHSVDLRCARWLLMCNDRVGQDTFPITHESLALLLRVRRASVTRAAARLRRDRLIGLILAREVGPKE